MTIVAGMFQVLMVEEILYDSGSFVGTHICLTVSSVRVERLYAGMDIAIQLTDNFIRV